MRARTYLWPFVLLGGVSALALSVEGPPDTVMQKGLRQYQQHCSMCHQLTGSGIEHQVPSLVGSAMVAGDTKPLIQFLLRGSKAWHGYQQPKYTMECRPQPEHVISDEKLAAILTYIRASWGNKATQVAPDVVRGVRAESTK